LIVKTVWRVGCTFLGRGTFKDKSWNRQKSCGGEWVTLVFCVPNPEISCWGHGRVVNTNNHGSLFWGYLLLKQPLEPTTLVNCSLSFLCHMFRILLMLFYTLLNCHAYIYFYLGRLQFRRQRLPFICIFHRWWHSSWCTMILNM
jgi:hypothetical protein